MLRDDLQVGKHVWDFILIVFFVLLVFVAWPVARSQEHNPPAMPDMPGMNHGTMKGPAAPEDPAAAAKALGDKRESEFNHHLAGLILVLAGAVAFFEGPLARRWRVVHYAWPACFLGAGLFLLLLSDHELWPIGNQSWGYTLSHSTEVAQHKAFSLILLLIGFVEFERVRGRFKTAWTGLIFPIVAMAGAVLLLFHVHSGDMSAPHAMEQMESVDRQHRWFSAAGFGIALASGLAAFPQGLQPFFRRVWPALVIVLGCLLMLYTE